MKGNGLLFLALGIGGLVWYESQNSASGTPQSPATGTPGGNAPVPPSAPPAQPANVPTAPAYTGPSLSQIYQTLVAAMLLGMQQGDTDVSCVSGMSGLGARGRGVPTGDPTQVVAGRLRPIAGGIRPVDSPPRIMAPPAPAPAACTSPLAPPDVWSWYLINKAGIPNVPGSNVAFPGADLSQKIDGPTYWGVMAPLLQQQIPGLNGLRALPPMMAMRRVEKVPMSYPYGGWGR